MRRKRLRGRKMVPKDGTQPPDNARSLPVPWVLYHILLEGTLTGHMFSEERILGHFAREDDT